MPYPINLVELFNPARGSLSQQLNFTTARQLFDQGQITIKKIKLRKTPERYPGYLFKDKIFCRAPVFLYLEKCQVDLRNSWVSVGMLVNFVGAIDFDSEFFTQLPSERVFSCFALFDFSSRKFPFQREPSFRTALAHQHLPTFTDQPRNDIYVLQIAGIHSMKCLTSRTYVFKCIHHRGPEFAEFGEFFNQELFTPCPPRLRGAISELYLTVKPEYPQT